MARQRRTGDTGLSEGLRLLDRYTILDRIGSGGMATIYRATDDRLDRTVCIKLLRTTLVEGDANTGGRAVYQATYEHFLKEALALSRLQHSNTLRIYDFGYVADGSGGQGAPFHVSEYLDGGNLETHVRLRGPIPPEESLGILEAMCGALDEAHGHGIIHRDIKPSNILFARIRGELVPKLADFGIASSDVKKKGQTSGGESVSTVALFSPRWAAPEQLCGAPEGPKTDVYALALVTIYMLAAEILFGDEDVRLTFNDRVRNDLLVSARLNKVGFTGELGAVISRAMKARSEERTASPPEFLVDLRRALKLKQPTSVKPFRVELPAPVPPPHHHPPQPRTQTQPPAPPQHAQAPQQTPQHAPLQHGMSQAVHAASHVSAPPAPPAFAEAPAWQTPAQLHAVTRAIAIDPDAKSGPDGHASTPEQIMAFGDRTVRVVHVHERLDLAFVDAQGGQVRVRVTMLPGVGPTPTLNIKGLSCFVARRGTRPTPATTANQDGPVDLIASNRQILGELGLSFGQPGPAGHVFLVDGRHLLVPYADAQQAVALSIGQGQDLIVMCRR